ncbi:MAG: hypothetical protein ACKVJG_23565 [Candidatus Latescibacterota bacterium]|jgi:dienelactone hydrolase
MDPSFFVRSDELALRFNHPPGARRLSFANFNGGVEEWKEACRSQLIELLGLEKPPACKVQVLRETQAGHVTIQALVLEVDETLSIPAYLLFPPNDEWEHCVMAIHGHGEAEPCIGQRDDYHRQFALSLAQEGYLVLCPELRGFGPLRDLALHCDGQRLDYWTEQSHKAFSLATDSFQHGWPLLGQTVEDLLRWEDFLAREYAADSLSVAGISYGGDLALTYPVFSGRVERIFASATFGSFAPVFAGCYNAPAHCIPSVLQWMDRADIAGLNAPRPIALHYGALDAPGPDNYSASYNETVYPALEALRAIYSSYDAEGSIELIVTPDKGHEMDNAALLKFLQK